MLVTVPSCHQPDISDQREYALKILGQRCRIVQSRLVAKVLCMERVSLAVMDNKENRQMDAWLERE